MFFFPNNEKILITVIYCTLSASQVELRKGFENFLDKLASLNASYLAIGYFNIDLMNLVSANQNRLDTNTLKFLECPLSHGLYPVCFVPSKITDMSFSLNDNILSPNGAISTYVIPGDSSGHCILMADFPLDFPLYFPHNKKKSQQSKETLGKRSIEIKRRTW